MIKKIVIFLIVFLGIFYVLLWLGSMRAYPVSYGISFSDEYAESLGLDSSVVYETMLQELQPPYIRIAANWDEIEPEEGTYDFGYVDWKMHLAEKYGAKVVLVVGQKAPRWPECHVPDWVEYGTDEANEQLLAYVRTTVERYKEHPALEVWQVENEPFIRFAFGECDGYNEEAFYDEVQLVRELDTERKILVTDSGELGLWNKAGHAGDIFGTTLYRIVRTPSGSTFTYDWVPAAFYRFKAKILGIAMDRFWVAELQGEPWFADGNPQNTSVEEQEETMNPERLAKHIEYTEQIGVERAYLWGVEWWYYMKEVNNDARYWDLVKEKIQNK